MLTAGPTARALLSCATRRYLTTTAAVAASSSSSAAAAATTNATERPWARPMPDDQFSRMRTILAAPSPVGLEAGMTEGVLAPMWEDYERELGWKIHRFRGNASVVLDTHPDAEPGSMLSVMFVGHADKIRMQVRDIQSDGKIYVDTDSFLPLTLLGNPVTIYSRAPSGPDGSDDRSLRALRGGTVEALGAIHFASAGHRTGAKGVGPDDIYVELQMHGEKRDEQLKSLGVAVGDSILLDRPIERGFAPDTMMGAYLDNGLGCFVASELAAAVAARGRNGEALNNVRCLFAVASHEEIGRFGSRVLAASLQPDMLVAVDVNHDYKNAPKVAAKKFPRLEMGEGFTLTHGSITSPALNDMIADAAGSRGIPMQQDVRGRDTGTDGMAGFLASADVASASIGFPIRNMHTISETGHTGDVLAAISALEGLVEDLEASGIRGADLETMHPRLDTARTPDPAEIRRAWDDRRTGSGASPGADEEQ